MYIELRDDYEKRGYLVDSNESNSESALRGAWCWISLTDSDPMHLVHECGTGSKMFLFEGAGLFSPSVVALIHADISEDAEKIVEERYGDRIRRKNLVRKNGLKEIIDEKRKGEDFDENRKERPTE